MKIWIVVLSLLISSFLPVSSALAQNQVRLNVSVFSLMPFGGRDGAKQLTGIIPEVLAHLSKETGYEFEIKVVPYKRMFAELESGMSDFAIFFKTPQSQKVAVPIAKVYTLNNVVVGRNDTNLEEYDDMKGRSISLPLGNYYLKKFDEDKSLKKIFVPNFEASTKLLINRRVDLVAGPDISYFYHLKNLGYSADVLGKPFVLKPVSAWLQASKRSPVLTPEITGRLKGVLEQMRVDGSIQRIMSHYKN